MRLSPECRVEIKIVSPGFYHIVFETGRLSSGTFQPERLMKQSQVSGMLGSLAAAHHKWERRPDRTCLEAGPYR
jgi:hypothetical protein